MGCWNSFLCCISNTYPDFIWVIRMSMAAWCVWAKTLSTSPFTTPPDLEVWLEDHGWKGAMLSWNSGSVRFRRQLTTQTSIWSVWANPLRLRPANLYDLYDLTCKTDILKVIWNFIKPWLRLGSYLAQKTGGTGSVGAASVHATRLGSTEAPDGQSTWRSTPQKVF